ncbi:MAG: MCE family protein, partial [Proteobacteria bacterium]
HKIPCVTYFGSSVQGLSVGAVVQMLGSPIGVIRSIELVGDTKRPGGWLARVEYDVQPDRLSKDAESKMSLDTLRSHPPRVFLDSTSFLTGQKALTFDFSSTRPPKPGEIVMEGEVLVLPGEAGGIDNVTVALGHIAGKLEQIPFDEIGKNLDATLVSVNQVVSGPDLKNAIHELSATMTRAHHLMDEADQGLTPALKKVPEMANQMQQAVANANNALGQSGYGSNSDFQRNMSRMMLQVSDAVRSVRLLADFLERHPESLIRGRTNGSQAGEK